MAYLRSQNIRYHCLLLWNVSLFFPQSLKLLRKCSDPLICLEVSQFWNKNCTLVTKISINLNTCRFTSRLIFVLSEPCTVFGSKYTLNNVWKIAMKYKISWYSMNKALKHCSPFKYLKIDYFIWKCTLKSFNGKRIRNMFYPYLTFKEQINTKEKPHWNFLK